MAKKKLNKKLLTGFVGLTAFSSFVAPLVASCGNNSEDIAEKIGGQFDDEYDVNESTLIALKRQFIDAWNKVVEKHSDWTDARKKWERNRLVQDLKNFDKSLAENKEYSYTLITNAIIDFAHDSYGIKIKRENVVVDDADVIAMFEGVKNSFARYMWESGQFEQTDIDAMLELADEKFDHMLYYKDEDGNEYGLKVRYDDPLAVFINAESDVLNCFDEVNDQIALAAGINHLKEFAQNYRVEYRSDGKDNTFDQLMDDDVLVVGQALSNEAMTRIFRIRDTLHPDREITEFIPNKLIPGYTVIPFLESITTNRYTNTYEINIDWQCVKSDFIGRKTPEELKAVTAHIYKSFKNQKFNSEDATPADLFSDAEILTVPYSIPLSKEVEEQALKSAYFTGEAFKYDPGTPNQGRMDIGWFNNDDPVFKEGYEAFYFGKKIEDEKIPAGREVHAIDLNSLAAASLQVKVAAPYSNGSWTEPVKFSDYMCNTYILDTIPEKELEDVTPPKIVSSFMSRCSIVSIASVESEGNETGKHTASNQMSIYYKNSRYNHREHEAVFSLPKQDVSGFTFSSKSYEWLTAQYNIIRDYSDAYVNNAFKQKMDAASVACATLSTFFSLGTLLNIIFVGLGIFNFNKTNIFMFILDMMIIAAFQSIETWKYAEFMDNFYMPTKKMAGVADDVQNDPATKELDDYLTGLSSTFGVLRKDKNGDIKKQEFKDNYREKFEGVKFFGDGGLKATLEKMSQVNHDPLLVNFKKRIEEMDPDVKTYSDYIKGWEKEGKYAVTMASLALASSILNLAMIVWTVTILTGSAIVIGVVKKMSQTAVLAEKQGAQAIEESIALEQKTIENVEKNIENDKNPTIDPKQESGEQQSFINQPAEEVNNTPPEIEARDAFLAKLAEETGRTTPFESEGEIASALELKVLRLLMKDDSITNSASFFNVFKFWASKPTIGNLLPKCAASWEMGEALYRDGAEMLTQFNKLFEGFTQSQKERLINALDERVIRTTYDALDSLGFGANFKGGCPEHPGADFLNLMLDFSDMWLLSKGGQFGPVKLNLGSNIFFKWLCDDLAKTLFNGLAEISIKLV